jgi:isoquinoline 1-oxidoreductase beta subunit
MEPLNCTARFADDKLDIWTGTQDQEETLKAAMEVTGLTADRINIHTQLLGGGFGRRAATDFVKPAIEAARKTGHPIKLIVERAEELRMGYFRPAACARLEAALTPDGRIAALRTHVAAPSVDVPFFGRLLIDGQADWFATQGLSTPHYVAEDRVTYYARVETGLPVWVWRGVGFTQNCFFLESFIDELAAAAKLDPLEFRLKNLKEPRARKVLETAAERAGWGRGVAPGRAQGMALFFHAQLVTALVVEVSMEEGKRPKVHRATCVLDAGRVINPDIVKAQAEGGLMMGLAPVLHGGVEVRDGAVAQSNFHDYRVAKMADAPVIDVHLIEGTRTVAMLGEFTTVLVAPAVANAVFRLTGTRRRSFPI